MENDFDKWNEVKKRISERAILPNYFSFPRKGEVWICVFGRNIGREENGKGDGFSRPALVVKKFNNEMFWVVPLSSKQHSFDFYYNFIDYKCEKAAVILAQIRLMSVKRFIKLMYYFPDDHFDSVLACLKAFLS